MCFTTKMYKIKCFLDIPKKGVKSTKHILFGTYGLLSNIHRSLLSYFACDMT